RSYFPDRVPKTVKFRIDEQDPTDQYARLYAPDVVSAINALNLPRYGLANYVAATPHKPPTPAEARQLQDLSRAGKRLMGFCRTNLFKRLESSGEAFQQSIERHILRNYIFLHAIEHGLPLPLGTQDAGLLDPGNYDEDVDDGTLGLRTAADFSRRASEAYQRYATQFKRRFKWLRPDLFVKSLATDLADDAASLLAVLTHCGPWDPAKDAKLEALHALLTEHHPNDKIIVFTQFADTVRYLEAQLRVRNVERLAGVTGNSEDPTSYAWRFSPENNRKRDQVTPDQELRVLIATDVLSEGQNLQDGAIIVNFDLPWAVIRLIQRAGRADRIGQKSEKILCYSFLPAEGVENLIRLRARVRQRLHENAEVVGTDEAFFEDERERQKLLDLYHEKAGILDGETETEVDLASYAYQIWKNAIDRFPELQKTIPALPPVVYSTRPHHATANKPHGVLVYLRTAQDNDALAWLDTNGNPITESQFEILKAAECAPDTPALPRQKNHHELVRKAVELIAAEEKSVGGQLGRPSGARFRTYERLKRYAEQVRGTLFESPVLSKAIEEIYRFPLRQSAIDSLNRQLRAGISDEKLAELAMALHDDDRLCLVHDEEQSKEPQIICSLGLAPAADS
ncbi:MAG: helicase-related protein, partial [Gammaproteobacteria bacterium]